MSSLGQSKAARDFDDLSLLNVSAAQQATCYIPSLPAGRPPNRMSSETEISEDPQKEGQIKV